MQTKALEVRDIPGFPGYRARSDGTIWSCVTLGRTPKLGSVWKELKGFVDAYGYRIVNLGRGHRSAIHRLIALAFIGPCPAGKEVLHWDGDSENCRPENLRYGTRRENCLDTVRHGRCNLGGHWRGSDHGMAKLTEEKVRAIKAYFARGHSQTAIASVFAVSVSTIHLIVRGKSWRHVCR